MAGFVGHRMYRGCIVPREQLEMIAGVERASLQTRLRPGQRVRVRLDSADGTRDSFLMAVVFDAFISNLQGVDYALAFPIGLGEYYAVTQGFAGAGIVLNASESAENSGIYTEEEFETFLNGENKPLPEPGSHLKVVK